MLDHDRVLECAMSLPALPPTVYQLLHLVHEPEPDLLEIARVIELDPVLTLKVLRLANSAFFSRGKPVGRIKDAVLRLGAGTILGIAVGAACQALTPRFIPGYRLRSEEFWHHCVTAGVAAELGRVYCRQDWSALAFTSAVLHDIGKLVLGRLMTEEHLAFLDRAQHEGKQELWQAERQILSLDHGDVGGFIATYWNLPDCIVDGIKYHHHPQDGFDLLSSVTFLADGISHRVCQSDRSHWEEWGDCDALHYACQALGLDRSGLERWCQAVHNQNVSQGTPVGNGRQRA